MQDQWDLLVLITQIYFIRGRKTKPNNFWQLYWLGCIKAQYLKEAFERGFSSPCIFLAKYFGY